MYRIFLVVIGLLLSGCAMNSIFPPVFLTPEPASVEKLSETQGIVFGSFSRDAMGLQYYSQAFYFRNIVTQDAYEISAFTQGGMVSKRNPDDFSNTSERGRVFAFSLPAGKYVFDGYRLDYQEGSQFRSVYSNEPYSIPFNISPNKTNYIGGIRLSPTTRKNIFGMNSLDSGIWNIENKIIRDKEIMKEKYPSIPVVNVEAIIPDKQEVFTPFVILPSEVAAQK